MHYIYGHAIMYIVQAGVLVEGLKWLHRNWTSTYLKRERRTVRSRIFLAGGVPGRGRSQGKTTLAVRESLDRALGQVDMYNNTQRIR